MTDEMRLIVDLNRLLGESIAYLTNYHKLLDNRGTDIGVLLDLYQGVHWREEEKKRLLDLMD